MSEENKLEPAGRISLIQSPKKHPLAKFLKSLDEATPEALECLLEIVRSPEADPKERRQAATAILDKKVAVSEAISKDQLTRIFGEIKIQQLSAPKMKGPKEVTSEEEDDGRPQVLYTPGIIHRGDEEDIPLEVEDELDLSKVTHI